jgi:hypothetical protein
MICYDNYLDSGLDFGILRRSRSTFLTRLYLVRPWTRTSCVLAVVRQNDKIKTSLKLNCHSGGCRNLENVNQDLVRISSFIVALDSGLRQNDGIASLFKLSFQCKRQATYNFDVIPAYAGIQWTISSNS